MNNFERNYWASCLDFIQAFKQLSYLGVPLPLVCPYYLLVNGNEAVLQKLESESTVLKTNLSSESQIQALFDDHFAPFKKQGSNTKGKVVFYDNVLRFPDQLMRANFTPSKCLVLKRKSKVHGSSSRREVPVDSLERYQNIQAHTIKDFQRKATLHFEKANNHPIYKNKGFRERFIKQIPNIMRQILAAKIFFEKNQVACLVTGTTNSSDTRILTLVAASKGIPSICLQHGVVMLEFGYLPKVATYQAVYGPKDIQWYTTKGLQADSLKSIGHPRFDELVTRHTLSEKAFADHFKLDREKKTILMVIHHIETEFPEAILEDLDEKGNVNIIIKQRNGKQRKSAQTLALQKKFPHLKFADDIHLYDLLNNVDAVVSYESTIVLEAMLAQKPVYIWRLKSLHSSSTNYYNELSMYIHDSPQELVDQMIAVMNAPRNKNWEKRRQKFLSTHYPHKSGTSSAKLRALVDSIINKG
ncbi:CDP-Glycerol:Poly(glycerophosphate) glycerophosphotransferase [Halobacillus karajensis]|uniref:CDP-glycerol glycerophosphotransferase family protein n=1 Tax=Halobacillus karajensis TaxID=195088 RepID=UPI0008A72193|nr:CDP-glycerol glycerophosphotransferase family protein [Halobacillus karajensis]SEH87997.1 CDP-Glycerol:Poly(glycerophosphate) glycerophosphotransferase [Halobacillus karajensis]